MIAILSPAKNMRLASLPGLKLTKPGYPKQTERLAEILKEYSAWELESLMKINPELAMRAFLDFQDFDWLLEGSAALLSYSGLAYQHLHATDFTQEDFAFAADHLRILSAFYGMLRPSDGILPYRLELQCKLKVDGKSLYAFWGDRLYQDLFQSGQPVINLASGEYSKAISPHLTSQDRWITCDFLVRRRGKLVTLPTAAKMARGQMARYLVKERLEIPEQLWSFSWEDFAYSEALSTAQRYVFVQGS